MNQPQAAPTKQKGQKPQPLPRSEYHDQGYELSPHQMQGARCRRARFNRNQTLETCSNKSARDVRVVDKNGEILGKGYFSADAENKALWTVGVKGTRDAQTDINLFGARLACARKWTYSSDFEPLKTYFWTTQKLLGRAHSHELDDGSLFLTPADACKGTPMYSQRGIVESLRRRPQLLQGLPRR